MLSPHRYAALSLLLAFSAGAVGCSGGGGDITAPETGTLAVTSSTTGLEPDPDGYTVQVDGGPAQAIGSDGTLTIANVTAGSHTVLLAGAAVNCTVAPNNPRSIGVVAGETTTVDFTTTCTATSGTLQVTSVTSGNSPDPDGYIIAIDDGVGEPLGVGAEIIQEGVAPGAHLVSLSGVAGNCQVDGNNPRSVVVAAGATASVAFAITCVTPSSVTGNLRITTSTTGADQDEDGYAVAVDGGVAQPIGLGATVTLANLEPGVHSVQLSGVTANCTPAGPNPQSVTVPNGGTGEVGFSISCVTRPANSGTIQVTTATTGAGSDPDGYAVTLDGGGGQPIGVNATLPITGLAPGPHSVGLTGVSDNCQITGENPSSTTVTPGEASILPFSIVCGTAPIGGGTLRVTTVTSGPDPDPDGYTLGISNGPEQSIGVNATVSVAHVAEGAHSVLLAGVAANCTVGDANPRSVTLTAGGTVDVSFSITCVAGTGGLTVTTGTTGTPADPDGYDLSVDGGATEPIAGDATRTLTGLTLGAHQVALSGLAANCQVGGENPRSVTIAAAQTATVSFAITCAPTTGGLAVTISGLPAGTAASVVVTGPNGYSQGLTATQQLSDLAPGTYLVAAASVTVGSATYAPSSTSQGVVVAAGGQAAATVGYSTRPAPSLNLRIDALYLTQSTQTYHESVPLVQGRDGYLRVFVLANETTTAKPGLRVRFFQNGALISTRLIPAPSEPTPTEVQEGTLGSSWNIPVSGSIIKSGLTVLADVDPDNSIPESHENDNTFPVSGTGLALGVRPVPPFAIRFVPVRQRANGLQGDVSNANKDQYLDLTRRLYPLTRVDADVHAVYTTTTTDPIRAGDDNGAWSTILSEIDALRISEGTSRNYFGVVRVSPDAGIAGIGYVAWPSALGYDVVSDRSRVVAHELGHNWGRFHSPCGNPGGPDPDYPYAGGQIGVFGFDVARELLRPPFYPDIMGYCGDPWISDYTYKGVLAFRAANNVAAADEVAAIEREQPCLLVWGRIVDGNPVLEPAFQLVTRPKLPTRPGRYRIEGHASGGAPLFSLSFDAVEVADDPRAARHFAFAVPLDMKGAARLESLRLSGPAAQVTSSAQPTARLRPGPGSDSITARRTGGGVTIHWNAQLHPMLMVRDPDTGEVLSFARGGDVEVSTTKPELEVIVSDRVQSQRTRLVVTGP